LLSFNKPFFFQAIDCVVWICKGAEEAAWKNVLCLDQIDSWRRVWKQFASFVKTKVQNINEIPIILFFSSAGLWHTTRSRRTFIYPVSLKILLGTVAVAVAVPSIIADTFPVSGPIVSGGVARLHRGQAAAPKKAPVAVKASNLGCKSTSVEAIPVRRRSQVV